LIGTRDGTVNPGKLATDVKLAGILFFFGGMEIILLLTVAESLYQGYSVHTNTISDLAGIGRSTSLFFDPALFLWGLSWLLGAYFLFRDGGKKGMMLLNILPGIGVMMAALSPENVNIAIHSVGAIIAFIPGAITLLVSYRLIGSQLRFFALFLGLLSLASVAIYSGRTTHL